MRNDLYYNSSDKITKIHAVEWIPEGEVKAVLQISHGMVEHIMRYDRFANYMNQFGFYVVGNDHLGHGESVTSNELHGYFQHPNGNKCVIKDIHHLRILTERKYPDVPYFVLGHSMGSFLIRQYIMIYGKGLSGAVIMGTGKKPEIALCFGKLLCKIAAKFKGWNHHSRFVDSIAFSLNNKKFEPARTDKDWLTKDEAIVDAYIKDSLCSFTFTLNGFYNLFHSIQFAQNRKNIERIPKDLPLLLIAGGDDPVGDFGKGVRSVYKSYKNVRIRCVDIKIYKNDRHELLNETDYKDVYKYIKNWLDKNM